MYVVWCGDQHAWRSTLCVYIAIQMSLFDTLPIKHSSLWGTFLGGFFGQSESSDEAASLGPSEIRPSSMTTLPASTGRNDWWV